MYDTASIPHLNTRALSVRYGARLLLTPLLLGALALLLSGCSNNPYAKGEAAQPVLYLAISTDPKTFDPSICYDVPGATIIDPIYATYLEYDYLKRDPYVLEPSLGATQPEVADAPVTVVEKDKDGKETRTPKMGQTWTFHIKKGLRFQDDPCFAGGKGREILGADFLYSWRRMADPGVPCPIRSFFSDKLLGMNEWSARQKALKKDGKKPDYSLPMEGLELDPADPYMFRIKLNTPYPQLRFLMAMHFTSPLAHEAVDMYGKKLSRHCVGCGPYVLADYKPKASMTLKANPNYRRDDLYPSEGMPGDREAGLLADAGKSLPFVKEVQYTVFREGTSAWNQYLQGYLDTSLVTASNFQQAIANGTELSPDMKRRGVQLSRDVAVDISYFAFNMNDPIVGNVDAGGKPLAVEEAAKHRKLRQAVSCSIDIQKYIDIVNLGLGKPAQQIVAPGLFGYDPNFKNPYLQYNVEKGKSLLAEAGYPNGIDPKTGERLTLYWDNSLDTAAGRQTIGIFQPMIEAIGIHVVSRSWDFPTFQGKIDDGQYQFMNFGWVADYPDPENFDFLLYGPNKRPGPNACNYANPQYDAIFDKMNVMQDGPERKALIAQLRDIAVEDCPWIYMTHNETFALKQPWVHNFKSQPVAMDSVKYWNVDGAIRARLQAEWNQPDYWPLVGLAGLIMSASIPALRVIRKRRTRYVRREQSDPDVSRLI